MWGEAFAFVRRTGPVRGGATGTAAAESRVPLVLQADVWDFDQTSAPDELGSVHINLESLQRDVVSDQWYRLTYMANSSLRPSGSIRIRLLCTQSIYRASLGEALRMVRMLAYFASPTHVSQQHYKR